ncbi:hypothetical protein SDC9_117637 [bioreactor metagenome]|uniref:Uncharacterized protein n=1 Tax=bioreactor metagenome TaxID=1076179 RepID=A0A645C181_9ZZZZ
MIFRVKLIQRYAEEHYRIRAFFQVSVVGQLEQVGHGKIDLKLLQGEIHHHQQIADLGRVAQPIIGIQIKFGKRVFGYALKESHPFVGTGFKDQRRVDQNLPDHRDLLHYFTQVDLHIQRHFFCNGGNLSAGTHLAVNTWVRTGDVGLNVPVGISNEGSQMLNCAVEGAVRPRCKLFCLRLADDQALKVAPVVIQLLDEAIELFAVFKILIRPLHHFFNQVGRQPGQIDESFI